jgi:hypothetical protein
MSRSRWNGCFSGSGLLSVTFITLS